jgi:hypothetical protein
MNHQGISRTGPLPPRFKELLQGCRQMSHSHLTPLFLTMLENADVALLEFAGKAESNAAQGKFFEAMQELKRKRHELEQGFFKTVDGSFRRFINGTADVSEPTAHSGAVGGAGLSLVGKDEIEAALPVQNMVAKANANYSELLYGLNQRLAVINGGGRVPEADLPGGPMALAAAARDVFNLLAIDAKTRMVIYAVFDRSVMRELHALYEEYNRRLVNAGVLPNLKYEIRKQHDPRQVKADAQAAASRRASNQPPQSIGEEAFQSILELMARSHGRVPGATAEPGVAGVVSEAVAASSRSTILGTIDSIQHEHSADAAGARFNQEIIENIRVDAALLARLKETLVEERERLYGGVDRRRVAGADADIIDLVGMLFDYMLQDEQLPNVVKALLSRLHTPFLKVAIIDRHLFTEKHHPGRRLLDAMADAGTRWVTEEDLERGIFPSMRVVVERILREFKDDLGLFDELLADFNAHLHEVEQKAQVIERRSVEAADGQARLQNARALAADEINGLLRTAHLHADARAFMQQVWGEKLTFILLREREGADSPAWKLAVKLADQLAWSLSRHTDAAERDRLHDALPGLRAELREGLEQLQAYGRRDNDKMFAQICAWQDQALSASASTEGEATVAQAAPMPAAEPEAAPPVDTLPEGVQAFVDRLGGLAFDTWFEFIDPETGLARRLKLAWYSKISSNYMFVDAMGIRAAEYARTDLARRLHAGQAHILELQDKPFLDRALETILTWLGHNKAQAVT